MQAALSFTGGWSGSSNASRPIFHWRVEGEQQYKRPIFHLRGEGEQQYKRPIFHLRVEGEQQCKPPYLSLAGGGGAAMQAALSFTGVWSGSSNASRPVFRSRAREPGGVRV
jgi:hypothetical protein